MTDDTRKTLLSALEQYRGDNLYRARAAFKNCTPEQMQQHYGQSGETRQAILDGYEQHAAKVDAAVAFVKEQA